VEDTGLTGRRRTETLPKDAARRLGALRRHCEDVMTLPYGDPYDLMAQLSPAEPLECGPELPAWAGRPASEEHGRPRQADRFLADQSVYMAPTLYFSADRAASYSA
jgi:hypothetical protein